MKPCPICGSEAQVHHWNPQTHSMCGSKGGCGIVLRNEVWNRLSKAVDVLKMIEEVDNQLCAQYLALHISAQPDRRITIETISDGDLESSTSGEDLPAALRAFLKERYAK